MKKKCLIGTMLLVLVLLLSACGCDHEWQEASCSAPKTCQLCGETEGEPLPHTYLDATCTTPKTCSVCSVTEGEPLGHTWQEATCVEVKTCTVCQETEGEPLGHIWTEATCTTPKTCSVCKLIEGETAPHTWQEATCTTPRTCFVCAVTEGGTAAHTWQEATTEAPKTCYACGATEGDRLITDSRFTTKSTKDLQGIWYCDTVFPDEILGFTNFGGVECRITLNFGNTGNLSQTVRVLDESGYIARLKTYTVEQMYASFAQQGMSREQGDQAMLSVYGMNVNDYVDAVLKNYDADQDFSVFNGNLVYYVQNNMLCTAGSWGGSFEKDQFAIGSGTLRIENWSLVAGSETLTWRRG